MPGIIAPCIFPGCTSATQTSSLPGIAVGTKQKRILHRRTALRINPM